MSIFRRCCCCYKQKTKEVYNLQPSTSYRHSDNECFFVITTVFNPAGFRSRYELYHKFARFMKSTGVQLITVECIFPLIGQTSFQVTRPDNPCHIQLRSNSVYWMKENLINIAVSRLPLHAKWVCWLDGDIFFHNKKWISATIAELEKYSVVQVFEQADFLGPNDGNILRTDFSFGYSVVHNKVIDQSRYDEWYPHPGYAWAMSVEAFKAIGGLPDYDIVGSGDLHFAFSLINKVSNAIERDLNPQFREMILNHTSESYEKLKNWSAQHGKSMVGYVQGKIGHNWHGSRKDRQYLERWKILIARDFNFNKDTQRLPSGLFELNKNKPELQEDILMHFKLRLEDGKIKGAEDYSVVAPAAPAAKKKVFRKKRKKMRGRKRSTGSVNDGFETEPSTTPDMPDKSDEIDIPDASSDSDPDSDGGNEEGNNNSEGQSHEGRTDEVAGDYENGYDGTVESTSYY